MKPGKSNWSPLLRLGLCGLLLLWVFHCIFVNEGRESWRIHGLPWDTLSRLEMWRIGWTLGPPSLWKTLAMVSPGAFALSLPLMGMTVLLGVVRWRMALQAVGLPLPFGRATAISMVAQCFNSFLLGSTGGDLLKAYYAARETRHQKTEAVVTVFVDRLIGLFAMLVFACLMMPWNWALLADHRSLAGVAALVAAMTLACAVLVVLAFWGGVSRGFPRARAWLRKLPKGELLERSLEACRGFGKQPGFLIKAFAVSMVLNVFCVLQVMTLAYGLKLRIPPEALFLIVPMIICISALPLTPSGLGLRENLFVQMLAVAPLSVEPAKALALSLLAYAGFLIWSLLGGAVYLNMRGAQHLDEVLRNGNTRPA